ncbi:hypothetical protein K439DRAFT_1663429 [Ramaria rubella]|nr:hypothetical protein K439DRAFT_1663429 [Ramaria rubella]
MFNLWNRKGNNKSPSAGRTSNVLPQTSQDAQEADIHHTRTTHPPTLPQHEDRLAQDEHPVHTPPIQASVDPVIAVIPNPHDAAIAEVRAKLAQAEQLSARTRTFTDPLSETLNPPNQLPEPLYDPATGIQRGLFEAASADTSGDYEKHRDEVWAHLVRIRELQSEISAMHMHMEDEGDRSGSTDAEVDIDVDVDTVPTQEEEEAAKREKEFRKLPGRFKGRSDNINAMMAKLDDLSQIVTSFHALQPPPLSFESIPSTRQNIDVSAPPDDREHVVPMNVRATRPAILPVTMFGSREPRDKI